MLIDVKNEESKLLKEKKKPKKKTKNDRACKNIFSFDSINLYRYWVCL